MNTILSDRLFSDPRLRALADRLRCPLRALGLLGSLWHSTQNMGVVYADSTAILNGLPAGLRRDRRYIDALVAAGFLVPHGELFRVIGNAEHVEVREAKSKKGKRAAQKRWGSQDAPSIRDGMHEAESPKMPDPIRSDALGSAPRIDPIHTEPRGGIPAIPVSDKLVDYSISKAEARELAGHYQDEQADAHGVTRALMLPDTLLSSCMVILALCSGDLALAKRIVSAYVRGLDPWWEQKRWAIWVLENPKNFEQARLLASTPPPVQRRTLEEMAAEAEAAERETARKAREEVAS